MPEDGPQADTTQSPSPLVAMLWTLMPGPGDHFDFVLMHANSEVPANDLLTTQSEADPKNGRKVLMDVWSDTLNAAA